MLDFLPFHHFWDGSNDTQAEKVEGVTKNDNIVLISPKARLTKDIRARVMHVA